MSKIDKRLDYIEKLLASDDPAQRELGDKLFGEEIAKLKGQALSMKSGAVPFRQLTQDEFISALDKIDERTKRNRRN